MKFTKLLPLLLIAASFISCKKVHPLRTAPSSLYSAIRGEAASVSYGNKPNIEISVKIEGLAASGTYTPILNFNIGDFAIAENGGPVIIEKITYSRAPISCVLVLDRSGSMLSISTPGDPAYELNQAIKAFVSRLIDTDMVMIIDFGSEVQIRTGMTGSRKQLVEALDTAGSLGMTSLWVAAGIGVDEMAKSPLPTKLLIVMSDGFDNTSIDYAGRGDYTLTSSMVAARALSKHIAVNCVGYGTYDTEMSTLASLTGGDFNYAADAAALTGIYESYIPTEVDSTILHYRTREKGSKNVDVYVNYGNLYTNFSTSYSD